MKKKNYTNEVFSINVLIGLFVFLSIMIFFCIELIKLKLWDMILLILFVLFITLICFLLGYIQRKKFTSKRNKIISTGTLVKGKIIDKKINVDIDRTGDFRSVMETFLVIEYTYNNKKETFTTPEITFKKENLLSNEVDVYISEYGIYVDNFNLKSGIKGFLPIK